jgi:hypothetical protein
MFQHYYRRGLTRQESEVIRLLRRRGFAVVLFEPAAVGSPLRRGEVERQMLTAGRKACQQKEEHIQCS